MSVEEINVFLVDLTIPHVSYLETNGRYKITRPQIQTIFSPKNNINTLWVCTIFFFKVQYNFKWASIVLGH